MPELPDVEVYVERLRGLLAGARLEGVRLASPFLLRSVDPPLSSTSGRRVEGARRMGKRIVIELEGELFLVVHLMIAGRLRLLARGGKLPGRVGLCAFDFDAFSLALTEAGTRRRASLHVVAGREALKAHDPGGVEPLQADLETFRAVLASERHTLKRALTDPRLFSGIGNAYSDEILHRARLSPMKLSTSLTDEESARLHAATSEVLLAWLERIRASPGPLLEEVTAFREGMAVHGRYGRPCPACGAPVQRVVYAENEMNYCAICQTENRLLADRALSRLLKEDWPRTLDELESLKRAHREVARRGGPAC